MVRGTAQDGTLVAVNADEGLQVVTQTKNIVTFMFQGGQPMNVQFATEEEAFEFYSGLIH